MTRLPRTKDQILDSVGAADTKQEYIMWCMLEVLIDMRDNFEIPTKEENYGQDNYKEQA